MSVHADGVTTTGTYYVGKRSKTGPVFDRRRVWEGDEILVYDYDLGRYVEAVVTRVDPDVLYFVLKGTKIEGTYSSDKAHETVKTTGLPHVRRKV